jgi:hypothetical protein
MPRPIWLPSLINGFGGVGIEGRAEAVSSVPDTRLTPDDPGASTRYCCIWRRLPLGATPERAGWYFCANSGLICWHFEPQTGGTVAKKFTIQYRQLKTDGLWDDVDLKSMLVDVLRRRGWADNAKLRVIDIDQDQSFVILNKLSDPNSWDGPIFAGQVIHLQEGSELQAVLQSLEEDTPEFVLQSLNVGDRARILKGALYFAVVGNHIGLVEGHQVSGADLGTVSHGASAAR